VGFIGACAEVSAGMKEEESKVLPPETLESDVVVDIGVFLTSDSWAAFDEPGARTGEMGLGS
jgi:hypothetical protein